MLKTKKILFMLLTLALVFAIASCGGGGTESCETCIDEDWDGICDVCEKEMPEEEVADLPLFEGGEPTFQVVLGENVSADIRQTAVSSIKSMLRYDYDIDIDLFYEGSESDDELDIEILIGEVSSRGKEYCVDGHALGKNGYIIKIVGQKVVINAGSEEMLAFAIETFAEDVLAKDDITDLVMTKDDVVIDVQNDYRVTSLKVNGNDMKGYTIATNLSQKRYETAALALQESIYAETGYWFDIVKLESATDKSIVMKHVDGIRGEESFKVSANGTQLVIECAFDNMFEKASMQFTTQKITNATGEVDFKGTVYTQDVSVVYYEDFGAIGDGDGKTDDFVAFYNAHVFANECGQTVKASRNPEGKVYYIYDNRINTPQGKTAVSIPIRTTTDWQGVKIIIDDENIPSFLLDEEDPNAADHNERFSLGRTPIFYVYADEEMELFKYTDEAVLDRIVAEGLNPETDKINFKVDGWNGPLMLIPFNSEHGVFRRRGQYGSWPLQSLGEDMHEIIIIDENGNVNKEETPIMFVYNNIDYMHVIKLDPSSAITVGNATIETKDSRVENKIADADGNTIFFSTNYTNRGIYVARSYTTVHDIDHIVSGGFTLKERANGHEGCNSSGMFRAAFADRVTFKDINLPGRQQYDTHSSYNFGANCVNKIVLQNCIQTNFWISVDENEGIMKPSKDYVPGAYTSMSSVPVYSDKYNKVVDIPMCWGLGGTNYCKNMEYIGSQISRFDAHQGLYNGKIIDSKINMMALTGYGDMEVENVDWYQYQPNLALFALRSDYGYMWNGTVSAKDVRAYIYDITSEVPKLNIVGHNYANFYYGYPTSFPSVTLDNIDVYSMKNQAPVKAGYEINIYEFAYASRKMHIKDDSGSKAVFTFVDADGDGYIDEPLFDINFDNVINEEDFVDFDKNGKEGNTSLKYTDYAADEEEAKKKAAELNKGIVHHGCTRNLNPIKPPEHITVLNNDGVDGSGGYVYRVVNTALEEISDGGWYRDKNTPDTMGGFFGGTKFIYDINGQQYILNGSNHPEHSITFKFIENYLK